MHIRVRSSSRSQHFIFRRQSISFPISRYSSLNDYVQNQQINEFFYTFSH